MGSVTTDSARFLCFSAEVFAWWEFYRPKKCLAPLGLHFVAAPPPLSLFLLLGHESLSLTSWMPRHLLESFSTVVQILLAVSFPFPYLCSFKVAPFKIAHRKDNCARRCCYKLMTVVTLKWREHFRGSETRLNQQIWCMFVESKMGLNAMVYRSVFQLRSCFVFYFLVDGLFADVCLDYPSVFAIWIFLQKCIYGPIKGGLAADVWLENTQVDKLPCLHYEGALFWRPEVHSAIAFRVYLNPLLLL